MPLMSERNNKRFDYTITVKAFCPYCNLELGSAESSYIDQFIKEYDDEGNVVWHWVETKTCTSLNEVMSRLAQESNFSAQDTKDKNNNQCPRCGNNGGKAPF